MFALIWYTLSYDPPLAPPLIRFGTSTWAYKGSQGQVYKRQYAKRAFARENLGEYGQYQYRQQVTRQANQLLTTLTRQRRLNRSGPFAV
jgi:hypothetical protein